MEYSLLQVSKQFGISKGAVRARFKKAPEGSTIKKGDVIFVTASGLRWMVQTYGEPQTQEEVTDRTPEPQEKTADATGELIAQLKAEISHRDEEIAYLKAQREIDQKNFQQTLALLEDKQRVADDLAKQDVEQPKKKWWHFGK